MVPKGGRRGGMNWEVRTDTYTLLCTKYITNENVLYSLAHTPHCSVMTEMGRKSNEALFSTVRN